MNTPHNTQPTVSKEAVSQRTLPIWSLWLFAVIGCAALTYLWRPIHSPESLVQLQARIQTAVTNRDTKEKERLRRRLVAELERQLGPEHPETLEAISVLAKTLHGNGNRKEAELLYRRVLAAYESKFGSEHSKTLASMTDLAHLLTQDERTISSAETLFRNVLEIRERVLGSEHTNTLQTANRLAFLLALQGDPQAVPMQQRAWRGLEAALGSKDPQVVSAANQLAKYEQTFASKLSK